MSSLVLVVAFATTSILFYIGISAAILPAMVIAWSSLIIALGIFVYISSRIKWT